MVKYGRLNGRPINHYIYIIYELGFIFFIMLYYTELFAQLLLGKIFITIKKI